MLSRRVNNTTEDDYRKLRRLMHYVYGTMDEKCYIGAGSLNAMITFLMCCMQCTKIVRATQEMPSHLA